MFKLIPQLLFEQTRKFEVKGILGNDIFPPYILIGLFCVTACCCCFYTEHNFTHAERITAGVMLWTNIKFFIAFVLGERNSRRAAQGDNLTHVILFSAK